MAMPIVSDGAQARLWSDLLKSSFCAQGLDGVGDDNTLAESGVYNSYDCLRSAGDGLLRSLSADADNIGAAAASYEDADARSAGGFR